MSPVQHAIDTGTIIAWLLGTGLPVIVGAVTKMRTHPAIKGGVLLVLSVATGVLSQWLDHINSHTPFAWQAIVVSAVGTYLVAGRFHDSFLKFTPLSNSLSPFGAKVDSAHQALAALSESNQVGVGGKASDYVDPGETTVTPPTAGPSEDYLGPPPPVETSTPPA